MNCLEYRNSLLTDPYTKNAEASSHVLSCRQCSRFKEEIVALDVDVRRALSVAVPEGLAARILLNQSIKEPSRLPLRWLRFGMAATFFISVIFAGWLYTSRDNLSVPLLTHVEHQPHEFSSAEHQPISNDQVEKLLKRFHVQTSLDRVVYASICPLDGDYAAHLVIKEGDDQYTVLLLPNRSPASMYAIDDGVWRGYVSPHPAGALAILTEEKDTHAAQRLLEVRNKLQNQIYMVAGR